MAVYNVYPIWGKDKPSYLRGVGQPYIIGISQCVSDIRGCRGFMRMSRSNALIVDWKSYRYKKFIHGYESNWIRFRMSDWYRTFRFTSPCEDWELSSKGRLQDAIEL